MSVAVVGDHKAAVIAALEAEGLNVGNATSKGLALPHAVVYTISGSTSGQLGDINGNAQFVFQVTCSGRVMTEAEFVENKAMILLNGISVSGRVITHVRLEDWGRDDRDDDQLVLEGEPRSIFQTTPRFRFWSVPA